ncbi:MAG: amidase [Nocardioidaceae bacterium]|jgi:amidase|nr:amidase [Nocardioidaceae bacterium]
MTAPQGTSREAVEIALARIDDIDPLIASVCTLNPAALDHATALDREAAAGRLRSPLHGRPILVKDNVDTADMLTTAGSLALAQCPPDADAPLVRRLRAAGMVLLGKTNLSEWANLRDEASTSGWSAYGGLTRNPYGLNRSSGGSSSGSGAAVAARLAPYAIGTETDGSITCPAAFNGCVGIKPTVGLIPGQGIVPISKSQDTAGPLAPTVREAARVLTVLAGNDKDYAAHAVPERLVGKRIGLPRRDFWGYSVGADAAAERAVELLAGEGATIVDNTDLTSMVDYAFDDEMLVLLSEMNAGMADYLATRPQGTPRTLADLVEFNRQHAETELRYFGQSFFEKALDSPPLDSPEYLAARAACLAHGRDDGIDAVLREHDLDALLSPAYNPATPIDLVNAEHNWGSCTQPSAMAGYPLLTVPAALVHGLPVAVTFWGTAGSEATLVELAAGYEALRDAGDGPLPEPTYPQFV